MRRGGFLAEIGRGQSGSPPARRPRVHYRGRPCNLRLDSFRRLSVGSALTESERPFDAGRKAVVLERVSGGLDDGDGLAECRVQVIESAEGADRVRVGWGGGVVRVVD